MELDFESNLPSKNKVYEIVKQLYLDLDTAKNSKSFNLTEAVFLLRNSEQYDFFAEKNY